MTGLSDYGKTYAGFWAEITDNPDGTLNRDQVMRELADYEALMRNATEVYCNVTGGRISKLETLPGHVINVVDERFMDAERQTIETLIASLEDAEAGPFKSTAEVVALIRELTGVEQPPATERALLAP